LFRIFYHLERRREEEKKIKLKPTIQIYKNNIAKLAGPAPPLVSLFLA